MNCEVLYRGAFAMTRVTLAHGESIKAEAGAMVAMSNTIDIEGKLEGGIFGAIGRMFSGESFFFQTLRAKRGSGEILLAPAMPGDVYSLELDGQTPYTVHRGGFLAASEGLNVTTQVQNLVKGLFSGEGFFVVGVSGRGTLLIDSYGAIHPIDVPAGEEVIIDNSHLVAWPAAMKYKIETVSSGIFSTVTSGEGFVCRFTGPGRVYIQSRNFMSLVDLISHSLPINRGK